MASESPRDLVAACREGRLDDARSCLDGGAAVDGSDAWGYTALWAACCEGHVDTVMLLLDRGADVNRQEPGRGRSPLYASCWKGHLDVARLLLDHGADLNLGDIWGYEPLHVSCADGEADISRLLLERGADIRRVTRAGRTPLYFARLYDQAALADWLERISAAGGWSHYLSEPRYALVIFRELVARGRARRRRVDPGKEQLLDFLFPCDQPSRRARRHRSHLPDDLFAIIAKYYWGGGGLSAQEEAAAATEDY